MTPVFLQVLDESLTLQLHTLYQNEWWSRGRTLEETRRLVTGGSLLFALVSEESRELIAFARVITDGVFKAFLFDVIVHPGHRSAGLGRLLMDRIFSHPVIRGVRHLELYCQPDRVTYYEALGFSSNPQRELVLMRRERNDGGAG